MGNPIIQKLTHHIKQKPKYGFIVLKQLWKQAYCFVWQSVMFK